MLPGWNGSAERPAPRRGCITHISCPSMGSASPAAFTSTRCRSSGGLDSTSSCAKSHGYGAIRSRLRSRRPRPARSRRSHWPPASGRAVSRPTPPNRGHRARRRRVFRGPRIPRAAEPCAATTPRDGSSGRSRLSEPPETAYVHGVARIGAQVAEALEYAHQQGGLCTATSSPPTCCLMPQGSYLEITDFGLAKAHDSGELTRTGDIVGTLRYMAPERFNGWSDPRSDVYALGATLYELLTLRPAFAESDRVKLRAACGAPDRAGRLVRLLDRHRSRARSRDDLFFKALRPKSPAELRDSRKTGRGLASIRCGPTDPCPQVERPRARLAVEQAQPRARRGNGCRGGLAGGRGVDRRRSCRRAILGAARKITSPA